MDLPVPGVGLGRTLNIMTSGRPRADLGGLCNHRWGREGVGHPGHAYGNPRHDYGMDVKMKAQGRASEVGSRESIVGT